VRRAAWALAVLCAAPSTAPAMGWVIEPAAFGAVRLDAVMARGLVSGTVPRLGAGIAVEPWTGVQLGCETGLSAGRADFGLLTGPTARLTHADVAVELRGRWPRRSSGWCVQGAAGAGRMRLAYHPGQVVLGTSAGAITVDLPAVNPWTRHVAAEVLHGVGRSQLGVRCAWRFYALDIASPAGVRRELLSDVQASVVLRVLHY